LSNIERFYNLLGCLRGEALDAVNDINVSNDTYELAWTTLSNRFDKPRQLTTLIVDKLLSSPEQSNESLDGLKQFLSLFSDQVSVIRILSIPDLGDFLLFSLSVRCLPLATRKGFEATNTHDFPTMPDLVRYVKKRISLLETVSCGVGSRLPVFARDKSKSNLLRPTDKRSRVSLQITSGKASAIVTKCFFCSDSHRSVDCPTFVDLPLE